VLVHLSLSSNLLLLWRMFCILETPIFAPSSPSSSSPLLQ